ncbi:MAG: DinB family protein [Sphingobacteriaceae bacterium]|nr:MAG: DinB family protein [Sphingobacteriaceae bacterium]
MEITEEKKTKLVNELQDTLQTYIDILTSFTRDEFNTIPYEGSWTPGQCAQHVYMSASGFNDVINGPVKDTLRQPDAGVEDIKTQFLNFDIKMDSPDFVRPEIKDYDRQTLLNQLKVVKQNLVESIKTLNLSQTCISFKVPGSDWFTRFEAASFVLYHTQRHVHQLKKMQKAFAGQAVD